MVQNCSTCRLDANPQKKRNRLATTTCHIAVVQVCRSGPSILRVETASGLDGPCECELNSASPPHNGKTSHLLLRPREGGSIRARLYSGMTPMSAAALARFNFSSMHCCTSKLSYLQPSISDTHSNQKFMARAMHFRKAAATTRPRAARGADSPILGEQHVNSASFWVECDRNCDDVGIYLIAVVQHHRFFRERWRVFVIRPDASTAQEAQTACQEDLER